MKYTLESSAPSYIFHNQHKTLNNLYIMALIRLYRWAGCYAPCYLQTGEDRFLHVLTHIYQFR